MRAPTPSRGVRMHTRPVCRSLRLNDGVRSPNVTSVDDLSTPPSVAPEGSDERLAVEPRWPVALALGTFIAISIVLRVVQPHREALGPVWLIPAIEGQKTIAVGSTRATSAAS